MKNRVVKFVSIVIVMAIISSSCCSMVLAEQSTEKELKKLLVENWWENFTQSYEIYKFNLDGTGSVYGASPGLYYDKELLAYCIKNSGKTHIFEEYMPDVDVSGGGIPFTYQINGNRVILKRNDFDDTIQLEYVDKKLNIDWDLFVYDQVNDNEKFFYEVDFYDEYGFENAFYLANTNVKTGIVFEEITVVLNGTKMEFDQDPVIVNGRTLVPLRAIFEKIGADVYWEDKTQTITSNLSNTTIKMSIDSNTLYKNGIPIYLDVPAQLINNYTMIPIRAVTEAFGANVLWEDSTQTVKITIK